jgi:hypothetical protein
MTREQAIKAFRDATGAANPNIQWQYATCEQMVDALAALGILKFDSVDDAAQKVVAEVLCKYGYTNYLAPRIIEWLHDQGFKITR